MNRKHRQTTFLLGVIVLLLALPVIIVLRRSPDSWGYLARATVVTAPGEAGPPTDAAPDPGGTVTDASAAASSEGALVRDLETRVAQLEAVIAGTPTASSAATPVVGVVPATPPPATPVATPALATP